MDSVFGIAWPAGIDVDDDKNEGDAGPDDKNEGAVAAAPGALCEPTEPPLRVLAAAAALRRCFLVAALARGRGGAGMALASRAARPFGTSVGLGGLPPPPAAEASGDDGDTCDDADCGTAAVDARVDQRGARVMSTDEDDDGGSGDGVVVAGGNVDDDAGWGVVRTPAAESLARGRRGTAVAVFFIAAACIVACTAAWGEAGLTGTSSATTRVTCTAEASTNSSTGTAMAATTRSSKAPPSPPLRLWQIPSPPPLPATLPSPPPRPNGKASAVTTPAGLGWRRGEGMRRLRGAGWKHGGAPLLAAAPFASSAALMGSHLRLQSVVPSVVSAPVVTSIISSVGMIC